jgi:hypothetical protein
MAGGGEAAAGRGERTGGGRGGFDPNMTPEQREERRKRMEERMAAMTPEDRKAFEERMAARGAGSGRFGGPGEGGGRGENQAPGGGRGTFGGAQPGTSRQTANAASAARPNAQRGRVANTPSMTTGATTIDSLFAPLPAVDTRGSAWVYVDKKLKRVALRLGITDNTYTEVIDGGGEIKEGTEVVTSVVLETQPATTTPGGAGNNPLMPQRGRGGRGGRG